MINIKEEELVELNKQGLNGKEIAEFFTKQGKTISSTEVNRRLREYYQLNGIERPKIPTKEHINIPIEEMVKLKEEQGLSDKKIAEYFSNRGQPISMLTVLKKLQKYYASQGRKKPIITKKIDIPVKEMANLKDQGQTYAEIARQFSKSDRSISDSIVRNRLKQYYDSQKKEIPIQTKRINISIEEMVNLKEQGLSDRQIAQIFTLRGKKISRSMVCTKLRQYYKSQQKEKPKAIIKMATSISNEEIVALKEQGLSNAAIARYFTQHGKPISATAINKRLTKYDQLQENSMGKVDVLEQILLNGMTIREYMKLNRKKLNEEGILNKLRRLRFVVEHIQKVEDKWVADDNFLEVMDILENQSSQQLETKYISDMGDHASIPNGKLIDIENNVFNGNADLMTYILLRLKTQPSSELDQQEWQELKSKYERKVKSYLTKLHHFEEKSRGNLTLEDEKKEENHSFDGETR